MYSPLVRVYSAVHIWEVLPDQLWKQVPAMHDWLSPDEQLRANRFSSADLRDEFTRNRGFLRLLLGCYLAIHPENVSFVYGAAGKPALANNPRYDSVLLIPGAAALYAVSCDREVGIDLEQWRDMEHQDDIARRYFSAEEVNKLLALPEADRTEAFFNCWTAKEAFIKATGDGMKRKLDSFSVFTSPDGTGEIL